MCYRFFSQKYFKIYFLFLTILQVLCEVFFPASESMNQNLASSTQSRLKAQCDSQTNAQSPVEEDGSTGSSEV
jgi:hypothetical protein